MTRFNTSKYTKIENNRLTNIAQKDFRDLSTAEMEQLMKEGVRQARKRMHDKGIPTVVCIDGKIYKEHPDGNIEEIN